ncbi:MAG: hypothetical protein HQL16_07100 [Candidatus Omnitrophica bacterium]|nr:hypothetical protein [Candidatus Omnitrophota bacterium]
MKYKLILVLVLSFFTTFPSPSWAALEDSGSVESASVEPTNPAVIFSSKQAKEGPARDIIETGMVLDDLSMKDMDIREAIEIIAKKSGLNIITGQNVSGRVTIFLKNVDAKDALRMVLESNNLAFADEAGLIRVMSAEEYATRYGHPFGQEKVTRMIKLNFVPVKDVLTLLNEMKSTDGKVVVNEESKNLVIIDSADKVRAMESLLREVDVQTVTTIIPLQYGKAQDILDDVRGMLTQSVGSVECNTKDNKLVVTDTLPKIEKIKRAVEELDAMGRKVILEAKLVHISLNGEHLGGVDWGAIVEDYQNIRFSGKYDFLDGEAEERVLSLGTIAEGDFPTLLDALDTVGQVREYPLADITVAKNEVVKLTVHFDEPGLVMHKAPDSVVANETDTFFPGTASLEFYVKSTISADNTIETVVVPHELRQKQKSFSSKQHSVTVPTEEGDSLVLGGLIATEKIAVNRKIPLMGDLPLVGFVFRFQNSSIRREEFVVFLTPKPLIPKPDIVEAVAIPQNSGKEAAKP